MQDLCEFDIIVRLPRKPGSATLAAKETQMTIELHTWNTPNGRKISVALEEMGLPYSVHPVNISKDEQFKPDFLKISPNNRIPAIIDPEGPGGQPISVFESGAILLYLGEKSGKFLPAGLRQRVPVLEWLMWQMGGFGPMPGQVHHFLQVENEQDRKYGLARYIKETKRLYGVLDRRLALVDYVAGDISVADFAILGWAWRHERHQVDLAEFSNVKRWYEQIMARPATIRGFEVALS
jgi:GST-like protein